MEQNSTKLKKTVELLHLFSYIMNRKLDLKLNNHLFNYQQTTKDAIKYIIEQIWKCNQ